MTERYDEHNETLWIWCTLGEDDLIAEDEIQGWIDALKRQHAPDGRPIRHVNYVFLDHGAAEYNHYPLKFAKLGTYVGSLDDPLPFDEADGVSFDTKDDIGM